MGFSVSIATAIIAIGLIMTATAHYGRVSTSYDLLEDARDEQHQRMVSKLDTGIEIYNTSECSYDGRGKIDNTSGSDYFYIKNTETSSINKTDLIVLVNGELIGDHSWSGWLYPGKNFQATLTLNHGDDVKIVTANGRSACAEVI
ncbi:hypothetical protein CW696_08885 [ANME-2 cluster archaeon]|nr:MAG: hypothetical protein CW696_08885 [ANME-2 cluster archaeon]